MISKIILMFTLSCFILLGLTGFVQADSVTLSNGHVYEGEVTAEEEGRVQIKLENSGARLWLPRDQILNLEKTNSEDPKKEKEEENTPKSTNDSIPLEDDVARAQALLEKMRAQQAGELNKGKNQKKDQNKANADAEKANDKPKGDLVTYSDEEVEALIEKMRHAPNIYDRHNACVELGKTESMAAVPHLIHALDDELLMMRKAANDSLIKITKQDFGYDPTAKRNVRLWAIDRWNAWHKEIKDEDAKKTLRSYF